MRTHVADAIVLRTYRYGEADRIVVFLTEDRGKKRGVAKNATKSRRRFGGALEPFTRGRVSYVEREGRELVRLDRIDPSESPLRSAQGRAPEDGAQLLGYASYFAELLDEWAPEAMANERLFRLGASVGEALCRGGSVDSLARYFEYWLLRLEGVYPPFEELKVSREAMALLRRSASATPAAVTDAGADAAVLRELEAVHARLIGMHLEKDLRSAKVVRELRPHL
jgi:DNA repair protein RecO (recombination protein O)